MIDERRTTNDQRRTEGDRPSSFVVRPSSLVVIGYGNALRGDDAAGPRIARAVAAWGLPGVRALAAHQLTPELAEALAQARDAIFVDARRAEPADLAVRVEPIAPHNRAQLAGHSGDPGALLALAGAVYGQHPRAWLIGVPASSFAYGAELSRGTRIGVAGALQLIRYFIIVTQVSHGRDQVDPGADRDRAGAGGAARGAGGLSCDDARRG